MNDENCADFDEILSDLKRVVEKDVFHWHRFFKRNADLSRILFRLSGASVILSSASIPVMAAFEFPYKNYFLSTIALLIAVLTGLNSFYRWEERWRSYRQSQFFLDQLITEWELKIIDAESKIGQEKNNSIFVATLTLINKVKEVRDGEAKAYFDNVQWPHHDRKV